MANTDSGVRLVHSSPIVSGLALLSDQSYSNLSVGYSQTACNSSYKYTANHQSWLKGNAPPPPSQVCPTSVYSSPKLRDTTPLPRHTRSVPWHSLNRSLQSLVHPRLMRSPSTTVWPAVACASFASLLLPSLEYYDNIHLLGLSNRASVHSTSAI